MKNTRNHALESCEHRSAERNGFTLIELLTVIAIIGILAGILIPVVGKVRDSARQSQNISNLREIGTSLLLIAEERGSYPMSWDSSTGTSWTTEVARWHGVDVGGGNEGVQHPILRSPVQFPGQLPEDVRRGATVKHYSANYNVMPDDSEGTGVGKFRVNLEQVREPSGTIMVGDSRPRSQDAPAGDAVGVMWWVRGAVNAQTPGEPINWPADVLAGEPGGQGYPAFRNSGRAYFVFADGHVAGFYPHELSQGHFTIEYGYGLTAPREGRPGR